MQASKLLLTLLVLLSIGKVFATTSDPFIRAFNLWSHQHSKSYTSDEFQYRFQVWKTNAIYIRDFNHKNQTTYRLAMNEYGDLTSAEFGQIYNGFLSEEIEMPENVVEEDVSALPSSVDWRQKGVVTGIKNQQQCGTFFLFEEACASGG